MTQRAPHPDPRAAGQGEKGGGRAAPEHRGPAAALPARPTCWQKAEVCCYRAGSVPTDGPGAGLAESRRVAEPRRGDSAARLK